MARALKVFRTPIGFHDAYVAAPTQKAALEAWGTDRNLFARGDAEIVTDPKLTKEPLAKPGIVIRKARGSAAEQIAALGKDGAASAEKAAAAPEPAKRTAPRPDRSALDAAEAELQAVTERHAEESRALDARIAALEKERRDMARRQERERAALEKARDAREQTYRRALDRWRA